MKDDLLEKAAQPGFTEAIEAAALDADARDRMAVERTPQEERLRAGGFRQSWRAEDGCGTWDHPKRGVRIIHSVRRESDGKHWAHVSVSRRDGNMPGWYEVRDAQRMLYPRRAGIVVIPAEAEHYSVAEVAHVWTCLDAFDLPDFRRLGAI
jgi:hypothetical protein